MEIIFTVLAWILTVLVGAVVGLIIYARWNYGFLEGLGIPVIKPFLFLGSNYKESLLDVREEDIRRQRTYGGVYGVYDGRRPQIHISDPKLIRQITTVDFDHFVNHDFDFGSSFNSLFASLLDVLSDEKWKTVRNALTPVFTGGKIKRLNTLVKTISEDYAETLLKLCDESGGRAEKMCFREFAAPMIIEVVSKCFCGIDIPNAKDKDNVFVRNMKGALLHNTPQETWVFYVPKLFPFLTRLFPDPFPAKGLDFFISALKSILSAREKSGENSIDATSTLVDMMKKTRTDPNYKRLGIDETVVLAQGWEFFLAGYAGIRDLFENFMYAMATNEDIQEKLYQDIKNASENDELSLEGISELPYLHACVMETGRKYPSFIRPERLCNKDWSYEGVRIPKGTQIFFTMVALHNNPEFYPDPDTFDPTRFMPGWKESRDPYTFLLFGQGPRGCIGQRFAIEAVKVMLVSFLTRFKIEKRPDTIWKANPGGSLLLTFKPIYLDVVKRE